MLNLVALIGILLGTFSQRITGQNCGCGPNVCCSRFGICETTNQSCAFGCQQGPCTVPRPATNDLPRPATNDPISDIVTPAFFNGIISKANGVDCSGKDFYSRGAFLDAVKSYPLFAEGRIYQKQEIAAFFAHVTHETGHFCHREEINGSSKNYCAGGSEYPCASRKKYYGRGPLMLAWNFNYGPAGEDIGFDGLNAPETVSNDPIISFKTALWYWMDNVHSSIISGEGFGATIEQISGSEECYGANPPIVRARISYYTSYCNQLGVRPGGNLTC